MKIGEIARRTGLTVHTIRYYERIGLLPFAPRDAGGQRLYDTAIVAWIEFLGRLKNTGMSIQEMLRYAELRAQGAGSEADRLGLLTEHRDRVRDRVAELRACLLVLDEKIAGYATPHRKNNHAKRDASTQRKPGKPAGAGQTDSVRD